MIRDSDCDCPESVEFVQSDAGLWDGRGWVRERDAAIQYPAGTRRAGAACRIVEEQTGRRCWVLTLRPEFAATN